MTIAICSDFIGDMVGYIIMVNMVKNSNGSLWLPLESCYSVIVIW